MKTYIHVRDSDQLIVGVGMIYFESGALTPDVAAMVEDHDGDEVAGITAYGQSVAPPGVTARCVDTADLPGNGQPDATFDKTFLAFPIVNELGEVVGFDHAWTDANPGKQVDVHLPSAKRIAHARRRVAREREFLPLDKRATIPSLASDAEVKRQAVRDRYAVQQINIDACNSAEELKALCVRDGLSQA